MTSYVAPVLWAALLAAVFFLLSNPLVFIPTFNESLHYAILFTVGVSLLLFPWLRRPRMPLEVVAFLAFCALTSLWSLDESSTWDGVVLYSAVALLALVIGANASRTVLIEGLTLGGVAIVLASWYAFAERLPGSGVPDSIGVLAGVGTNRNILAYTLVLALCGAISDLPRPWWWRAVRAAAVGTILVGIYLSGSATGLMSGSLVIVAACLITAAQRWGPRLSRRRRRRLTAVCLVAVATAVVSINEIAGLLDRDTSFSGRAPFWAAAMDVTQEQDGLLAGFGWGAVWAHAWQVAPPNEVAEEIYTEAGAVLSHGHSSLFDLIPQVGIIGTALALALLVGVAVRGLRLLGAAARPRVPAERAAARFLLIGVVGQITLGLTEPLLTIPLGWFCVVLLAQLPSDEAGSAPADTDGSAAEPAVIEPSAPLSVRREERAPSLDPVEQ